MSLKQYTTFGIITENNELGGDQHDYKPKPKKIRAFDDIRSDIEYANSMIESYKQAHKGELEKAWKHNRDEFQKEFDMALEGELYEPDLRKMVRSIMRVPEGYDSEQESL